MSKLVHLKGISPVYSSLKNYRLDESIKLMTLLSKKGEGV